MECIKYMSFCSQVAAGCNLTCASADLSLTQARRKAHTALHLCCNLSAHTRWPTVCFHLVGLVHRSQHGLQTFQWLTIYCRGVAQRVHYAELSWQTKYNVCKHNFKFYGPDSNLIHAIGFWTKQYQHWHGFNQRRFKSTTLLNWNGLSNKIKNMT